MERILSLMTARHGFDFGGYRRSSLERRVRTRADALGIPSFAAYADYLRAQPAESQTLFDTLLIHVTSFFRDPEVWLALARTVFLPLKSRLMNGAVARIWNPGCATGEETCTLLMVLDKAIGAELRSRVRVIATDVDAQALAIAERGAYSAAHTVSLPAVLRDTYFRYFGSEYVFRGDLLEAVTFHTHDLLHGAPVPEVDLVVCRNTLMYFDAPSRRQVLKRMHGALKENGCLLVGRSELLLAHTDLFRPVDHGARIFERCRVSSDDNAG